MPEETRSRITILLPAPTTQPEFFRLNDVLTELIDLCGGVTVSSIIPPCFEGWWIDALHSTVEDSNVLIFGDVRVDSNSPALAAYLTRLKATCQADFQQDIVWITVNEVKRAATGDYNRSGVP